MVEQFNSTKVCLSAHALCALPLASFYKLSIYTFFFFSFSFGNHVYATPTCTLSYILLSEFVQRKAFAKLPLSLLPGLCWGILWL